jgi:hypothetical protein
MGIAGNKGGVGIRFRFYESDVCFINCHFASGDSQIQHRNQDYRTIEYRMTFNDCSNSSSKDNVWYTPGNTNHIQTTTNQLETSQWLVNK